MCLGVALIFALQSSIVLAKSRNLLDFIYVDGGDGAVIRGLPSVRDPSIAKIGDYGDLDDNRYPLGHSDYYDHNHGHDYIHSDHDDHHDHGFHGKHSKHTKETKHGKHGKHVHILDL